MNISEVNPKYEELKSFKLVKMLHDCKKMLDVS